MPSSQNRYHVGDDEDRGFPEQITVQLLSPNPKSRGQNVPSDYILLKSYT